MGSQIEKSIIPLCIATWFVKLNTNRSFTNEKYLRIYTIAFRQIFAFDRDYKSVRSP